MVIFNGDTDEVLSPDTLDMDLGYLERDSATVFHSWIIDTPAVGHDEVIAEYPNGGKEIEWVVDIPEEGHWETRNSDGELVEHFDGIIPDDWSKDEPTSDIWEFLRYRTYTEEEIAAQNAERAEAEKAETYNAQLAAAVPMMVRTVSPQLTDKQAKSIALVFPEWTPGETYVYHEIFRYEDELYRVGQPELVASEVYKPGDPGTESLYSHISIDEEGYEVWKPWDGITGLYNKGDIRRDPDDGQLYICIGDNCTYGPPHSTPSFWQLYTE